MEILLQSAGLSELQAKAYMFLLQNGDVSPPAMAKALGITRTNAYKVLDRLIVMKLAFRAEQDARSLYSAGDPAVLLQAVASEKNRIRIMEESTQAAIQELQPLYESSAPATKVAVIRGKAAITETHQKFLNRSPVHVISSDAATGPASNAGAEIHNATVKDYDSRVAWTCGNDNLLITLPGTDAVAIHIQNLAAAEAFRQIWKIVNKESADNT